MHAGQCVAGEAAAHGHRRDMDEVLGARSQHVHPEEAAARRVEDDLDEALGLAPDRRGRRVFERVRATPTVTPRWRAAASVRPTWPTAGMVNVAVGKTVKSATRRFPRRAFSAASRPSYQAAGVCWCEPVTSPAA